MRRPRNDDAKHDSKFEAASIAQHFGRESTQPRLRFLSSFGKALESWKAISRCFECCMTAPLFLVDFSLNLVCAFSKARN